MLLHALGLLASLAGFVFFGALAKEAYDGGSIRVAVIGFLLCAACIVAVNVSLDAIDADLIESADNG